jgi:hypothetical protein
VKHVQFLIDEQQQLYCGNWFQHYIQPFTGSLWIGVGQFAVVQFKAVSADAQIQGMVIGRGLVGGPLLYFAIVIRRPKGVQ